MWYKIGVEMDNIVKKILIIIGSVFFIIGACLVGVWLTQLINHHAFIKNAQKTDAVITDIFSGEKEYQKRTKTKHKIYATDGIKVIVSYYVNGREYKSELGYYSSNMKVGDEIAVYYREGSPKTIRTNVRIDIIIYGCVGIPFLLIGSAFLLICIRKIKSKKRLLRESSPIYATITGVSIHYSVKVNNIHPYQIDCQYTDPKTNIIHIFHSEGILYDPSTMIQSETVPVYVNPKNYNEYYVDIDAILPKQKVVNHS